MYTARKTAIGKLRAYRAGLARRYQHAIANRRFDEAARIHDRLWSVRRHILVQEELSCAPVADDFDLADLLGS